MRNVDRKPWSETSSYKLDRIVAWLDNRTQKESWAIVSIAVILVAALDYVTYAQQWCMVTLYILPGCLSAWTLRVRGAVATTAAVIILCVLRYPLLSVDVHAPAIVPNALAPTIAFCLLLTVMLAFRRDHDRVLIAARQDPLTGVLNKKTFRTRAETLFKEASAAHRSVLLAYIDFDGFKAVNDRYGHQAGDEVLQAFASDAMRSLRSEDCFGRLGGDEFGLVAQVGPGEDAEALAKRLHGRFTAALAASGHAVTCSMGALIVPADNRLSHAELVRTADRLMYAAKHAGKNAVMVATAASTEAAPRRIAEPGAVPHLLPASQVA
jgi:diguanylate cyclase (GGDEF)-like protein